MRGGEGAAAAGRSPAPLVTTAWKRVMTALRKAYHTSTVSASAMDCRIPHLSNTPASGGRDLYAVAMRCRYRSTMPTSDAAWNAYQWVLTTTTTRKDTPLRYGNCEFSILSRVAQELSGNHTALVRWTLWTAGYAGELRYIGRPTAADSSGEPSTVPPVLPSHDRENAYHQLCAVGPAASHLLIHCLQRRQRCVCAEGGVVAASFVGDALLALLVVASSLFCHVISMAFCAAADYDPCRTTFT